MRDASPRVRRIITAVAVTALVAATALPAWAASTTVRLTSTNRYKPASPSINRGDRIVWKNVSNKRHNIVAYGSNWNYHQTLNAGAQIARRFNAGGNYKYRCTIGSHSNLNNGNCTGMCGVIRVG